jgi:hypothetical protein
MVTQGMLETRFWAVASYRIASAKMTISPICENHVRSFIQDGAQEIILQGFGDNDVKVALAEANLQRFVAKMIDDAAADGDSQLHETRYTAARSLCPVWPFC